MQIAGRVKGEPIPRELDDLAHAVIGAAMEVHRELGPGFLEAVYEKAFCIELELRGIPFRRQVPIDLYYKGNLVGSARADLILAGAIIVELKAVEAVIGLHTAQTLSYLKATSLRLGLLINFNVPALKLGLHRLVI